MKKRKALRRSELSIALKQIETLKEEVDRLQREVRDAAEIHGESVDGVFVFRCKGLEKSPKSGLVQRKKCEARETLENDALGAKIGVDRAANEPRNRKNRRPSYRESESTYNSIERSEILMFLNALPQFSSRPTSPACLQSGKITAIRCESKLLISLNVDQLNSEI